MTRSPHMRRRRSGVALVYLAICMVAMMALCSLAVDVGHYEVVQSQIYSAAVAAARAGANAMSGGATATTNAATTVATDNIVDGFHIQSSAVTVNYVNWNTSNNTYTTVTPGNFATANGVQVIITYTLKLPFAQVIGEPTKLATKSSIAIVQTQSVSPYIYATSDPWLAGEAAGTHGSQADPNYAGVNVNSDHKFPYDIAGTPGGSSSASWSYSAQTGFTYTPGQPYSSPVQPAISVVPGARITVSNVSGSMSYDLQNNTNDDATGNASNNPWIVDDAAANGVSEHGISDAYMPIGAINAVFLNNSTPDGNTPPPVLNFSTQASRDYTAIAPKLQQVFYVGQGQTSTGTQQEIVVPANATRMFVGVMDGWEWDNNTGGFNVTITQKYVTTVQ